MIKTLTIAVLLASSAAVAQSVPVGEWKAECATRLHSPSGGIVWTGKRALTVVVKDDRIVTTFGAEIRSFKMGKVHVEKDEGGNVVYWQGNGVRVITWTAHPGQINVEWLVGDLYMHCGVNLR